MFISNSVWETYRGGGGEMFSTGELELGMGPYIAYVEHGVYLEVEGVDGGGGDVRGGIHVLSYRELLTGMDGSGFRGRIRGIESLLGISIISEAIWSSGVKRTRVMEVMRMGDVGYASSVDGCTCGSGGVIGSIIDGIINGGYSEREYCRLCYACRREVRRGIDSRLYRNGVRWFNGWLVSAREYVGSVLGVSVGSIEEVEIDYSILEGLVSEVNYSGELEWLPLWYIIHHNIVV